MGADRKANALVPEGPAYSRDCSVELPLRPSARAAPPLGPSLLSRRLRAWWRQVVRHVKGADTKANTLGRWLTPGW